MLLQNWVLSQFRFGPLSLTFISDLVQAALEKAEHVHRQRKKREEDEEEERKKASHEVKFNMEVVYHDDESKMSAINHDDDE